MSEEELEYWLTIVLAEQDKDKNRENINGRPSTQYI